MLRFIGVRVPQCGQGLLVTIAFRQRYLNPRQDASKIRPVIAIMEQRDVPAPRCQRFQKTYQRARPLGEFETVEHFVGGQRRPAADQMAQVQLGQLVVGEVQCLEAGFAEAPGKLRRLAAAADLDPYIDMGTVAICNAVVELGDVA